MSTNMNKQPASERGEAAVAAAEAFGSRARYLPVMALAWAGLVVVTAAAVLCPRFTVFYAVFILVSLALGALTLVFLNGIFRKRQAHLLPAFKKFLGYGLVVHYAAAALPRVDWANAGLVDSGRVVYMFVLSLVCLAAGSALFIACGRPATYAALGLLTDAEAKDRRLRKKRLAADRKKGFVHGALEWIDALGFAAILVILINTFVFQLYEIPSESMVPTFLNKDRPFTVKYPAGPRIPLTDWRLPFLKLPQRGDVITLSNPRYPENNGVNLKKYLSQLVSMITFTAVNIDRYLPDGTQKADPLVKRIVGLPGEKLMMVDDVLYAKRAGDESFHPVKEDAEWAHVDLWKESADLRSRIDDIPMSAQGREILSAWDARKRDADPALLADSIKRRASALGSGAPASRIDALTAEIKKTKPAVYASLVADRREFESYTEGAANPIAAMGTRLDDVAALSLALSLGTSKAARNAFAGYARAEAAAIPAANAFERGSRVLNLLIKTNVVDRVSRYSALIAAGMGIGAVTEDAELQRLEKERLELDFYVNGRGGGLYDARNFAPFPAGDSYLGPTQYFAMGDNRYNSVDFRHRTFSLKQRPLDPADPSSVMYWSNIDPFALDLKFIEGYALFRIWPPSRMGALK
jgi:signal peptidase I